MFVRFAPSPTGAFHAGNLRTAWISFQWARALKMKWAVRFEDIDTPRVLEGAQEKQLRDMRALGLNPDKTYRQSERRERHWSLFLRAAESGALYPCMCSRKELRDALSLIASAPHSEPPVYNGHCRMNPPGASRGLPSVAWRFRNPGAGDGSQDFIAARTGTLVPDESSFAPAYHWACAIDDADGNYELLVRAWDLESSAAMQRSIQKWVFDFEKKNAVFPAIFHTSLVVQDDGHRLEKRTAGVTLAELLERGISIHELLERFEKSFSAETSAFQSGRIWGEAARTLAISKLDL